MKTSTRKNSSSNLIDCVKGLLFYRKDCKPKYVTVAAWVAAGKPSDCFVYDGAHQLLSAGIPIVDSVEVEGRWVRTHLPVKCKPTTYKKVAELEKKRVGVSSIVLKHSEFITSSDAQKRKLR